MQNYQEYLDFAGELADLARPIAQKYFKQPLSAEYKADQSPVTIADKEIEKTLRAAIQARYPDHAVIGEEYENLAGSSDYCWVLDPIDGTKAFMAGFTTFTTLIGMNYQGNVVVGVVDQPILKERWAAIAPTEALVEKASAATTATAGTNGRFRVATTSADYFSKAQKAGLEALKSEGYHIIYSGDAYAYMMLTEDRLDAVFDVDLKPFDILPLLPILQSKELYVQFFSEGKTSEKPTGNIVVARDKNIGKKLLETLL